MQEKLKEKQVYQPRKKDIKNIRQERKKMKRQNEYIELEDYSKELTLAKKLKSGKITIEGYKKQIKDLDPEDLLDQQFDKKTILSIQGHKKKKK